MSPMPLTRADFLRYTSIAAGLTAVALTQGGSVEAAASTPDLPDDLLDSQRFRRAVEQGDLALVTIYLERGARPGPRLQPRRAGEERLHPRQPGGAHRDR